MSSQFQRVPPGSSYNYSAAHFSQHAQHESHTQEMQQTPHTQRLQRAHQEDYSSPTPHSKLSSKTKADVPPNEQANIRLAQIMFTGGIFSGRYGVDQLELASSDPPPSLDKAYETAWQEAIKHDGLQMCPQVPSLKSRNAVRQKTII